MLLFQHQALWLLHQLFLYPTVAMIQELTKELQSMEQESLTEEQESEVTQENDLEQEDSEEYLTETDDQ